jgi:hypothetical protein
VSRKLVLAWLKKPVFWIVLGIVLAALAYVLGVVHFSGLRCEAPAKQALTPSTTPARDTCSDQPQPLTSRSVVLETPTDPITVFVDQSGNGTVSIYLKNNEQDPITLKPTDITASDFCHHSDRASYLLNSQATVTGIPPSPVAAGQDFALKIVFTHVWETGESTAQLRIGPATICNFRAIKEAAPFAIQIDGQNPEIIFGPGALPAVTLSNGDHATYKFKWSLIVPDRSPSKEIEEVIEPNGKRHLDLSEACIKPGWFSAGTLRDELLDGVLQLRPEAPPGISRAAAKQLALKIRVRFWPKYWQQFFNVVTTAFFILLGMAASLLYRYFIPNAVTAARIKRQLRDMKRRLDGIDENLPTQPRTVLQATRESLEHELGEAGPLFSPAVSSKLAVVQSNTSMCDAWIETAYTAAEILGNARQSLQTGLPPTLMRITQAKCESALHPFLSGFTKPEEQQAMNDALKGARLYLDAAGQENPIPDLEDIFKKRQKFITRDQLGTAEEPGLLRKAFPEYGGLFDQTAEIIGDVDPTKYRDFDIVTLKVTLLIRYRDLSLRRDPQFPASMTAGDRKNALERMAAHRDKFLAYVNSESHESLNMARVLLAEMEQDFYPDALIDEIHKDPPGIEILGVPSPVEPGVPVHYSLRFIRTALNHVAAVQEWSLIWRFLEHSEPKQETITEAVARTPETQAGWDVYHRFKDTGSHLVAVDIFDIDGHQITDKPISLTISMEDKPPERKWYQPSTWPDEERIEYLRMAFVLFLALAGVFTAARSKVEQLGIFEGAAALVAIGFAADVVKSVISDKPGEKT